MQGIAVAAYVEQRYTSRGREATSAFSTCKYQTILMKVGADPEPYAILFELTQQNIYAFSLLSQVTRA